MNKILGYLAAPYQHLDPLVRKKRLLAVTFTAAQLFHQKIYVFSPLTHNVPMKEWIEGHWDTWREYDELLLSRSDKLYVLMLDGWKESKGVTAEIAFAQKNDIPIEYITPPEEEKYFAPKVAKAGQGFM